MARRARSLVTIVGLGALLASCQQDPEIRAQTLLVVDTDLSVAYAAGEVPVAAMDTLRVDILDGATVRETRELVLANPADWPLSLGVLGPARLRLRLFRASLATVSDVGGAHVLEPRAEVSVDRLVELGAPAGGVNRRRVLLTGECLGYAADLASGKTCLDRDQRAGVAGDVPTDNGAPSQVGTWSRLTPAACTTPDDPDRPCIPGSYDVVGDLALVAVDKQEEAPLPLRAVVVSPFRMDRTEVTVGRFRALLATGWTPHAPLPLEPDPTLKVQRYCTFLGANDKSVDDRPLNCLTVGFARELCAASKGRLPTEAEWEHAARGRDGRLYPWGSSPPTCCMTSASRGLNLDIDATCLPRGLAEPVGSHPGLSNRCPEGGDVSREGVLDLAGSVSELTSDTSQPVAECGQHGLTLDPTCISPRGGSVVEKGADWTAGLGRTRAAYRGPATDDSVGTGFRCVYPEPTL